MKFAATLADNDVPCQHLFAAKLLYTESFGGRIATVPGTAECFFMCHFITSLRFQTRLLADQFLRLIYPLFAFNATLEIEFLVHFPDCFFIEFRDLFVGSNTKPR